MPKKTKKAESCNHALSGAVIYNGVEKILLLERVKEPYGWAPPAGHVGEKESFKRAALREVKEKTGMEAVKLKRAMDKVFHNKCRMGGGNWHHWNIFRITKWDGRLRRSKTETRDVDWFSRAEIGALAERTEAYLKGKISEREWKRNPGLEVVWHKIFKNLGII